MTELQAMDRGRWVRAIVSGCVLLATLAMAAFALYLCYLHVTLGSTNGDKSQIKFGKNFEVSSNIVGLLVLFLTFFFFTKAGAWFHGSFPESSAIAREDFLEFLGKQEKKHVSRSELLDFITRGT